MFHLILGMFVMSKSITITQTTTFLHDNFFDNIPFLRKPPSIFVKTYCGLLDNIVSWLATNNYHQVK